MPDRTLAVTTGLAAFAFFAATAAPGLTGGDAGELIVSSQRLAVAHPPGYPLYVLLGHLASLLAPGALAFRLNLFSAVCGATAIGLLAFVLRGFRVRRSLALVTCALAATTPLWWEWSTRAEVFALNTALCLAALAAVQRNASLPAGLLAGLALSNHHTALFFVAPALVLTPRKLPIAVGLALGLLPYATLPLLQSHAPADSWGNTAALEGFVTHLLRREYGTFSLAAQSNAVGVHLGGLTLTLEHLARSVGVLGLVPVALGAFALPRRFALALLTSAVLLLPVFHLLARMPVDSELLRGVLLRFAWLPLVVTLLFFGAGLEWLAARGATPRLVAVSLSLAFALTALGERAGTRKPNGRLEAWASAVLEPLPENAVLLSRGDVFTNALRYTQATGVRDDVLLLDEELLTFEWYVARQPRVKFPGVAWFPNKPQHFDLAALLEANPEHLFFRVGNPKPGDDSAVAAQPFRLVQQFAPVDVARAVADTNALTSGEYFRRAMLTSAADVWEQAVLDDTSEAPNRAAVALMANGAAAEALPLLMRAFSERENVPAHHWKNLAISASRIGDERVLKLSARKYLELEPDAPDRATFEQALRGSPEAR